VTLGPLKLDVYGLPSTVIIENECILKGREFQQVHPYYVYCDWLTWELVVFQS